MSNPISRIRIYPTQPIDRNGPSSHSEAVRAELISSGVLGADAYVVVAGPANVYAHYVTTREEYGVQRYEGASTIFGPCKCFSLSSSLPSPVACLHFGALVNLGGILIRAQYGVDPAGGIQDGHSPGFFHT
jgi:hypothetical protein